MITEHSRSSSGLAVRNGAVTPATPTHGLRHAVVAALAIGCLLVLPGCQGVLDPRGPVGSADRMILFNATAIMLAIVIPTILATLTFAWWFRASNTRARYRPDFVYSGRIELVVWSIPTLVILFLGGIIWIGSYQLDPARALMAGDRKPVDIQAVSLDWKWLFIYPDQGVASVNQVVVPAGTPIRFSLTSSSVMNVFFVPQLGSMIYTMNGMVTQNMLQADQPGDYYGRSAHFSGDGFPDMQFTLRAAAPDEFNAWIAAARGSGRSLDTSSYADLARPSAKVQPFTYRSVEPDLFHAIATQAVPPGPGPANGPANPRVSRAGD